MVAEVLKVVVVDLEFSIVLEVTSEVVLSEVCLFVSVEDVNPGVSISSHVVKSMSIAVSRGAVVFRVVVVAVATVDILLLVLPFSFGSFFFLTLFSPFFVS